MIVPLRARDTARTGGRGRAPAAPVRTGRTARSGVHRPTAAAHGAAGRSGGGHRIPLPDRLVPRPGRPPAPHHRVGLRLLQPATGGPRIARYPAPGGRHRQPGAGYLLRHPSRLHRLLFRIPHWLAHHLAVGGILEQPALAVALGLLGTASWLGWWRLHRRARRWAGPRRPRRWPRWALAGAGTLVVLLSAAAGLNAYVGYVPTVGDAAALLGLPAPGVLTSLPQAIAQTRTGPAVVAISLPSARLGMPHGVALVQLPQGYDPHRHYPVLYLLGGAPGRITDWLFAGQVQSTAGDLQRAGLTRPMIIVMPSITPHGLVDYECLNAVHGPQIMTYLADVVVPSIDARFPTLPFRGDRGIAGFSAGADCALNVGLHHLGLFGLIGAIEPEGRPGAGADWVLADNPRLLRANSPIEYLRGMVFRHRVAVYLSGVPADRQTRRLAAELTADGQRVFVHNQAGYGHTWSDARVDEPYLLEFFSTGWAGPVPRVQVGPTVVAGRGRLGRHGGPGARRGATE